MLWFFVLFIITAVFAVANEERIVRYERTFAEGVKRTIGDLKRGR